MIHCSLHGRLGADPVARETKSGTAMATASIAVDAARHGVEPETAWFSLVAFGKQADALLRHAKGDMLSAMGTLSRSHYTARTGDEREQWSLTCEAIVSTRTVRPAGRKPAAAPGRTTPPRQQPAGTWQRPFDDEVPL